jgi:hypothetical protein
MSGATAKSFGNRRDFADDGLGRRDADGDGPLTGSQGRGKATHIVDRARSAGRPREERAPLRRQRDTVRCPVEEAEAECSFEPIDPPSDGCDRGFQPLRRRRERARLRRRTEDPQIVPIHRRSVSRQ